MVIQIFDRVFHGFLGIKSHEGNISVEMCSDKLLLKHALHEGVPTS